MPISVTTAVTTCIMSKLLITIVGPTAIGKTALSIKLAQYYKTEILSADSRQFFKEMYIGTAVPTPEELASAPHHFIQHLSIEDSYSAGQFEKDAISKINELYHKHDILILVGGSGMYINAVLEGLNTFPKVSAAVKEEVAIIHKNGGATALQELLLEKDPIYHKEVDLKNTQRVMRALEVSLASSRPFSSYRNQPKPNRNFESIKIGLTAGREFMYHRINKRVDLMMKAGLLEEVRGLLSRKHLNALQTVGYRELFEHLESKTTLEKAVENMKTNTRRFAKRQLTWNRRDLDIHWFDFQTPVQVIIECIQKNARP